MGLTYLDHENLGAAVAGTTSGRVGRGGGVDRLVPSVWFWGMKGRRDRVVRPRAGMEMIYRGHDT